MSSVQAALSNAAKNQTQIGGMDPSPGLVRDSVRSRPQRNLSIFQRAVKLD
jgi:hypothetical protein